MRAGGRTGRLTGWWRRHFGAFTVTDEGTGQTTLYRWLRHDYSCAVAVRAEPESERCTCGLADALTGGAVPEQSTPLSDVPLRPE